MKLLKVLVFMTAVTPALSTPGLAQDNRIDTVGADAPSLAAFGPHAIGVRTLELLNPQQVDVTNSVEGEVTNYYDRRLAVEVWYPATLAAGQVPGTDYSTETRNVDVLATLHGRAVRDAAPDSSGGAYPLVILSHGYPGNRYLMSHLGENLASKGYVVAGEKIQTYLRTMISNQAERNRMKSGYFREAIARGIAEGIQRYRRSG